MATIDLGLAFYTRETGIAMLPELETELARIPGVEGVGLTSNLPLGGSNNSTLVWAAGKQLTVVEGSRAEYIVATPSLFSALGIGLREGRLPDLQDRIDTKAVAAISRSLSERLWPGESTAGKMLSVSGPEGPFLEVVGVVDDVKYESLSAVHVPAIYRSMYQAYGAIVSIVLKTGLPPDSLAAGLRAAVRRVDPDIPVFRLMGFNDHLGNLLWPSRMGAVLASIFGLIAVLLAAIGLYGLMSFCVSRRIREIGIRTALGAKPGDLLRLIMVSGTRMIFAGLVIGVLVSLLVTRPISSLLYGIVGFDLTTIVRVGAILEMVAMPACYLPASRAARTDPMRALRYE